MPGSVCLTCGRHAHWAVTTWHTWGRVSEATTIPPGRVLTMKADLTSNHRRIPGSLYAVV